MINKKIMLGVLVCLLVMLIIPSASATSYWQYGDEVDLKVPCISSNGAACNNSALCNITIFYPNTTILLDNAGMSWNNTFFNYTLSTTQTMIPGEYTANVYCNDSYDYGWTSFLFGLTLNGTPPAGDGMNIFMILAFLAILVLMIVTMIKVIADLANMKMTAYDVGYAFAVYFGLFALYYFSQHYFADAFVSDLMLWMVRIGAFTNVIFPVIALIMAYVMSLNEQLHGRIRGDVI